MVKIRNQLVLDASIIQAQKDKVLANDIKRTRKGKVKSNWQYCKPICPCISSTFVDLEEEFKYLHSTTFVQLDELCKERGSYFLPTDSRRTAVDIRSSSDFILKSALDSVTASSPYFMCVIGNHYGQHKIPNSEPLPTSLSDVAVFTSLKPSLTTLMDRNLLAAASHGFPWVLEKDFQMCSMMELEVLLACFLETEQSPKHCFVYIKDYYQTYLNEDSISQEPPDIIDESISNIGTFFEPESEYAQKRLNDLKRRITNKGLSVKFFTSKEVLGQAVFQDWSEVILNVLPTPPPYFQQGDELFIHLWSIKAIPVLHQKTYCKYDQLKQLEVELHRHVHALSHQTKFLPSSEDGYGNEMYCEDETSINAYKIGDGIFSSSTSFVASIKTRACEEMRCTDDRILALIGDSGSGKTAFIANWLNSFQKAHPELLVISEFVGSSYFSSDIASFCRQCIRTLRERCYNTRSMPSDLLSYVESYGGLCQAFAYALSLVPCVIVIDGINSLRYAMNGDLGSVKGLSWLPKLIPSNCRIIVSTNQSDLSYKVLQGRRDVKVCWMPSIARRTRKLIFGRCFRKDVTKALGHDLVDKVWTNRLSERPLFLVTLSDLLRSCRNSREIEQVIDKCTAFRAFRDFWRSVFLLWSRRFSWSKHSSGQPGSIRHRSNAAGWVADALKLIATSRCGLKVAEILHLLSLIGYRGRAMVTPQDWDMLAAAAGAALYSGYDGLISIGNSEAKLALEHYLLGPGKFSASTSNSTQSDSIRQQYHSLLGSYFLKYASLKRKLTELPWHLQQGKDWLMLCQVLCRPRFFLAMCEASLYSPTLYLDYISYWKELMLHDFNISHCMKLIVEQATEDPSVVLDENDVMSRRPSVATQITHDTGSKSRIMGQHVLRGPSMIIVTQHDDHAMSFYKSTEESRSETEDRDFSETESSAFFLTETEVDHHLLVGGWTPVENDPEQPIDCSLLNSDQLANLHVKICWFLYQLGDEFTAHAEKALEMAYKYLEEARPLTTNQQLSLFDLTLTECRRTHSPNPSRLTQALSIFDNFHLKTMKLSYADYRHLLEAKGKFSLHLAQYLIKDIQYEDAYEHIQNTFNVFKKCNNIRGIAQATWILGKLLSAQGLTSQAQLVFSKAFATLLKWFGGKHLSVADVLIDIGQLYSRTTNDDESNQRRALLAYKQALEILQFNKRSVESAYVTKWMGELLLVEGSFRSLIEAQSCFETSHDVFVTKQVVGPKKIGQIARSYRRVSSDLQIGKFSLGKAERSGKRTLERPYSAMSWHSKELKKMISREQETPPPYKGERRRSLRESLSPASNRPYSAFTARSVGTCVLVTPRSSATRRVSSARDQKNSCPMPSARALESRKSADRQEQETTINKDGKDDSQRSVVPKALASFTERPATSEGKEVPVIIVPAGRNSRLSVKLELEDWEKHLMEEADEMERLNLNETMSRSELSTSKRSARLLSKSPTIHSVSFGSASNREPLHKHRCNYISGPGQLSLTVHGPHSAVTDVLRSPHSPKSYSYWSNDNDHRSSRFSSRYNKVEQGLSNRQYRSPHILKRPNSVMSASAAHEGLSINGSLATLKSNNNIDDSSPVTILIRNHSEPQLHKPVRVAFDSTAHEEILSVSEQNEGSLHLLAPTPSLAG